MYRVPRASLQTIFRHARQPFASDGGLMLQTRMMSELVPGNKAFLIDTMAMVRKLEGEGMSTQQAEVITSVVSQVIKDSLSIVSQSFVTKEDMQKNQMLHEAALSKFNAEVKSHQDHQFSILQQDIERLRNDIEKLRSELRYEIDKVTASQRLDMNLEKGRTREELSKQKEETTNLTNKLDREIHALKTQLEAAKYEVIKYCIGTVVSVTAVGLGLLRILK